MVKYQFLQLEANVYLLGERRKRRGEKHSDYKIKNKQTSNTQKYFDTKRKQQWRGANKVTDPCDIT